MLQYSLMLEFASLRHSLFEKGISSLLNLSEESVRVYDSVVLSPQPTVFLAKATMNHHSVQIYSLNQAFHVLFLEVQEHLIVVEVLKLTLISALFRVDIYVREHNLHFRQAIR